MQDLPNAQLRLVENEEGLSKYCMVIRLVPKDV